jgi:hypothetical protein
MTIHYSLWKYTLEKTEGTIKGGQSIDKDNIGHNTEIEDKQNKTHNTENTENSKISNTKLLMNTLPVIRVRRYHRGNQNP